MHNCSTGANKGSPSCQFANARFAFICCRNYETKHVKRRLCNRDEILYLVGNQQIAPNCLRCSLTNDIVWQINAIIQIANPEEIAASKTKSSGFFQKKHTKQTNAFVCLFVCLFFQKKQNRNNYSCSNIEDSVADVGNRRRSQRS
jgi:hypothetical protein